MSNTNWKANSAQFYSSDPLGTSEVAERKAAAEDGSRRLFEAIRLYVERHQPRTRL